MSETTNLTPLERDALREALRSPTRSLVRTRAGYMAVVAEKAPPRASVRLFTTRLVNMLDRDGLVDFDPPEFPQRVTLNAHGLAIAQQLATEDARRAVRQ